MKQNYDTDKSFDIQANRTSDWKKIIAGAVRDPALLCQRLGISDELVDLTPDFSLFVPEPFLKRIKPGDPMDPLLLQILPQKEESVIHPEFTTDPLEEKENLTPKGILSKYQGRSLIVAARHCSIHCRFCFRRHLPGIWDKNSKTTNSPGVDPQAIARQFGADPTIHEAILSGAEPLMLSDGHLEKLIFHLNQVNSIQRIRIHTRMPITIPQRITRELLGFIGNKKPFGKAAQIIVVVHVNHPNELDEDVLNALQDLIMSGCTVLSQTVLLHKVNDTLPVLAQLFERLINTGVTPYYLHQLDRVAGAAHFEVPPEKGCDLINRLRAQLPGYAVPRYVREIANEPGKVVLK